MGRTSQRTAFIITTVTVTAGRSLKPGVAPKTVIEQYAQVKPQTLSVKLKT